MTIQNPKNDLIVFLFFIILFLVLSYSNSIAQVPFYVPYSYQFKARVARVIDGDSFVLSDSQRVRMLGIDTPELTSKDSFFVFYANKAKLLTDSLIAGKVIKLTLEGNTRDFFGRLLAYVWLTNSSGKDSLFIQAEHLKKGFARISYYPEGSRYYDIFYNLRRTAMKNNIGIWSR